MRISYSAAQKGQILLLNESDQEIEIVQAHSDIVRNILLYLNRIISVGEDNKVLIDGTLIYEHKNFAQDAVVLGDSIISAGFDGSLVKSNL